MPTRGVDSWLEKLFSMHGKVVDAKVVYYEFRGGTKRSRGFGFVTMATEEQSYCAINSLNKQVSVTTGWFQCQLKKIWFSL